MHKSKIGIVAYTATEHKGQVTINKAYAGITESITTKSWGELADFITQDKGKALHICWSLYQFSDTIFSLLPRKVQKELEKKSKVIIENTKIFNTSRLLGITVTKPTIGNIFSWGEVNLYSITQWLPSDMQIPNTAQEVERLGYNIINSLDELNIYPSTLTSPIGLFSKQIDFESLPTIYNFNQDCLEAMNWANEVAQYEWRQVFNKKATGYQYDLTSAYPYFISQLPDTTNCTIEHSNKWLQWDWGIVKACAADLPDVHPINKNAKYLTTEEALWIFRKGYHITIKDGWYFKFNSNNKPYQAIVNQLIEYRNNNENLTSLIAKRIAQGLSGKLDQQNKDDSIGELYNPILALMVRSRCRLTVANFIYDNYLEGDMIRVLVDSVEASKELNIPKESKAGKFRRVK